MDDRDPVDRATDDDRDLHGVVTWEPRTVVDRIAVGIHGSIRPIARALVVLTALVLVLALLASGAVAVSEPELQVLSVLSVVPALVIAWYVHRVDVTSEPASIVVATFLLGLLLAPFAGVVNSTVSGQAAGLGIDVESSLVAGALYYLLVVGIGEETVKLLAVRLYAFRHERFDAVIDGAAYGAVAGLGFALIENALYISGQLEGGVVVAVATASVRALAGPGHVIYSAVAGYYLGLAKFNPKHAGPLVVKGILVAATLHAGYNTLVGLAPGLAQSVLGLSPLVGFVLFVVVYDTAAGYVLYRKLSRYRRIYSDATPGESAPEPTELRQRARQRARSDGHLSEGRGRGRRSDGERSSSPGRDESGPGSRTTVDRRQDDSEDRDRGREPRDRQGPRGRDED